MKRLIFSWFVICIAFICNAAGTYSIRGLIIDRISRKPLPNVAVLTIGDSGYCDSDSAGNFVIDNLAPGAYTLSASAIGRKSVVTPEYYITNSNIDVVIEMSREHIELEGVTVTAAPFRRDTEIPIGLRIIGIREIEKSPGANRDISKIVQSYPGVAFSPDGYRNDLIVRGGGPSENRFYLDGIEIPNINHFSTEGASGGPVGIINADLIREVKFYTGYFPADRGNALSSVLDFKLRDGNFERNTIKATLGASEAAFASEGHFGEKTSYIFSVRQSYLQLLFKLLGLPFLPTYTDGQFKIKTKFNPNNELTVLGLCGIDNMKLNTSLTDEKDQYILSYLPVIKQETFTLGAAYKHYAGNSSQLYALSHSYLNNRNTKYKDNDESQPDNLTLRLRSVENETKFRFENNINLDNWTINAGATMAYARYTINSFQRLFLGNQYSLDYDTSLDMVKWGVSASAVYSSVNDDFTASFGLRSDGCNYSSRMQNMLKTLSPRASISHRIIDNLFVSASSGLYYQLPPYSALAFKNNQGSYENKSLPYMRVWQNSIGFNWSKYAAWEISVEQFLKNYSDIPLSVTDNIPLTCKGDDYGIIGNEALKSTAKGRAYGIEILVRWFIAKRLNMSSAITLYKSEYKSNDNSSYIPSSWDNKFIVNVTGTYSFNKNWSLGMKFKCIGGAPYTPYDVERSSLVSAWDVKGKAYLDYSKYNTLRTSAYYQLDIRADKTFYIGKCMLGLYLDLQNVTGSKFKRQDALMSTGEIENQTAPLEQQRYKMKYINNDSGSLVPTLGVTFEY